MLWDIIRDFFVKNFFGGVDSLGDYHSFSFSDNFDTSTNIFPLGGEAISIGDWLSSTFTIISFILFYILIILFLKWIFKVFSNTLLLR